MSRGEFKPIPTGNDVEAILQHHDHIGVDTYGLWIIRAIDDPNLTLVTRKYNTHLPLLPAWMLCYSDAKWHAPRDDQDQMRRTWIGLAPKVVKVLPYIGNAPVTDGAQDANRNYPIMPVLAEASVEDERDPHTEWQDQAAVTETLQEKMEGNSLFAPYMQLCIDGLRLARQYTAAEVS